MARLWHAATLLREHRGDAHFAALLASDIDGCEAVVLQADKKVPRAQIQPVRGWTDEEWDSAAARLVARRLLTQDGQPDAGWGRADGETSSTVLMWRRPGPGKTKRWPPRRPRSCCRSRSLAWPICLSQPDRPPGARSGPVTTDQAAPGLADLVSLADPAVIQDPYPLLARMREASPFTALDGALVVYGRYADCSRILRDPRASSAESVPAVDRPRGQGARHPSFLSLDPPDHTRMRRLVSQAFTLESSRRWRPGSASSPTSC